MNHTDKKSNAKTQNKFRKPKNPDLIAEYLKIKLKTCPLFDIAAQYYG